MRYSAYPIVSDPNHVTGPKCPPPRLIQAPVAIVVLPGRIGADIFGCLGARDRRCGLPDSFVGAKHDGCTTASIVSAFGKHLLYREQAVALMCVAARALQILTSDNRRE